MVRRATAALAGYPVKHIRASNDNHAGWHYRNMEGRWIGAFKTMRSCLDDIFQLYLGEAK